LERIQNIIIFVQTKNKYRTSRVTTRQTADNDSKSTYIGMA
jgi:hypothetical protein